MKKAGAKVVKNRRYNSLGRKIVEIINAMNEENFYSNSYRSTCQYTLTNIAEYAGFDRRQLIRYFKKTRPKLHIIIKVIAALSCSPSEGYEILSLASHIIKGLCYENFDAYVEIVEHPEYTVQKKNELLAGCKNVKVQKEILNCCKRKFD